MRTLVLVSILLFAAPALAVTQWMDAAELDIEGNPLDGFVATRAFIDNRDGLADIAGVRYAINFTGTPSAMGTLTWENPDNPWYGASNALIYQLVDGKRYTQGTVYYPPTMEWGPAFAVDPTPENDDDVENNYWINDTVPAGVAWDRCFDIQGADVRLFASPASAETVLDGQAFTLFDYDRLPQTVPGPAPLVILAAGLAFIRRRSLGR